MWYTKHATCSFDERKSSWSKLFFFADIHHSKKGQRREMNQMFEPGDFIVYGNSGVCKVLKIGLPEIHAANRKKLYYTLQPLYSTETIYTPVDSGVFMRPVLSREEAESLIAEIPKIQESVFNNRNLTLLSAHYEAAFQTHNCEDLIQLIKSIYAKNVSAVQHGKKPGQIDQRYMKRAETLLHGELAVSLGIPLENVADYIAKAVASSKSRQNAGLHGKEPKEKESE